MAYRLLIVAASMPVASAFAATGSHLISLKPALQASMLLPDPAITADVASIDLAPMTLLAMSKADAALADAFGAIFPLGTLATAAFVFKVLIDNTFNEDTDGTLKTAFIGVFAIFSFIFFCLAVPF